MDFVNTAIAQISELFRSMTPGARVTAGLLLAVVVVSVGYLFQQGTSGPDAYLFGGQPLSDSELNLIDAAIAQARLSGHVREGNRIRVPSGQQAAFMAAVADGNALPRNFNTILENALNQGGPWESSEMRRERMRIAKQQTLGEIVRAMPWVQEAVVLYDEQAPRGIIGTREVTATVSVRPLPGEVLHPRRVKTLQTLVANSVLGLQPENVAVTNLGNGSEFGGGSEFYPEAFDDEFYALKVAFETQKKRSIENALRDFPGARVEVNAELDDTVEELTKNVTPEPKATVLKEITSTDTTRQSTTEGGGRPGVFAQGPNRGGTQTAPARQNQNETSSDTTETVNVVGHEQRTIKRKGFTPKEIWATVTIPSSHVKNLWRQRNPKATEPPKPEDLAPIEQTLITKVENIVEPLLLQESNKAEDTYKHVKVVIVETLPAPTIEAPTMANQAIAWTSQYWSTLAMFGVAMFSLLILRSIAKSNPAQGGPASSMPTLTLESQSVGDSHEASDAADISARPRLKIKKGTTLKDDLADIVRDDPDAAADILRSWIGKAG